MPLAGVPIALKDTEDLEGEVTCWGTAAFDEPAAADGEMVRRLREAGAVVLGKTNLPELAICGFTETEAWGITRNPWDTDHTPGGSSGGSGAALAAGLCAGASASDGAGSIRIPAALCGLFGLKPQRDRISLAPFREHWHGLSVTGSLARSVADSALWLDVCHGGVAGGPPPPDQPFSEAARTKPGGLRVAYSTKPPRLPAPPIIRDEVKARRRAGTADLLRSLGHAVEAAGPRLGPGREPRRPPLPERGQRRGRRGRRTRSGSRSGPAGSPGSAGSRAAGSCEAPAAPRPATPGASSRSSTAATCS